MNKNTFVYYEEAYTKKGEYKTSKRKLYGFWDGEKVKCSDKQSTTVSNTNWLTPVITLGVIRYILLLIYHYYSYIKREFNYYYRVKTGKLLPHK